MFVLEQFAIVKADVTFERPYSRCSAIAVITGCDMPGLLCAIEQTINAKLNIACYFGGDH